MLHSIKKAIVNYFYLTEVMSEKAAMSIHESSRLIKRDQQSKSHPTSTSMQACSDKEDGTSQAGHSILINKTSVDSSMSGVRVIGAQHVESHSCDQI
ncbi:hypothetical protein [Thalassoglobus sp.]|uniref:hypothetical protein n=1 Tax=Thalassoglobus sp. TaxID=2795869 RepID=UPI003AA7B3A2